MRVLDEKRGKLRYIKTDKQLTIFIDKTPLMCDRNHVNYNRILDILKELSKLDEIYLSDLIKLKELFKPELFIKKLTDKLEVIDGKVYYKNKVLENVLTKKLINMIKEGYDVNYLVLFIENLMENPSNTAIMELYQFLENGNLPISKDGHFYAYKKVNNNFKDIYSNTFDNSIGSIPTMERNMVNDNRYETCSTGLHFCSYNYLESYASNDKNSCKVVVVKVNPKDVVSIPIDYNFSKARTCRYEVVKDITKSYFKSLNKSRKVLEEYLVYDENEMEDCPF